MTANCASKPISTCGRVFSWQPELLRVISLPVSALFGPAQPHVRASASSQNDTAHEPRTRTKYSYDTGSQLTGTTYTLGSNPLGNLSYGYDNDGRRSSVTGSFAGTGLPLAMSQTAYNANNQLTTWGTANLFYDLNGNMTSDGTHSYTWDARNRLSQIDSGNTANFAYDAFGRRTSKTILGTQTGFLYDRANPVQELSGTNVIANSMSGGIDEVFQRTDSAGARSFLTDALGNTLALTDSTGATQTSYTFEPFGNTTTTGAATTSSFAYTGRELDATGLYYYRARYYNPATGRFISEDPLGYAANSVNFYELAYDSSTNYRDPSGMQTIVAEPIAVGAGAAAGTAAGTGAAAGAGASGFAPTFPLIVGGSAEGGSAGGPLGVAVGVVVGLGIYDGIQGYQLCQAYGICGPNPSPSPQPKPPTAGRKSPHCGGPRDPGDVTSRVNSCIGRRSSHALRGSATMIPQAVSNLV